MNKRDRQTDRDRERQKERKKYRDERHTETERQGDRARGSKSERERERLRPRETAWIGSVVMTNSGVVSGRLSGSGPCRHFSKPALQGCAGLGSQRVHKSPVYSPVRDPKHSYCYMKQRACMSVCVSVRVSAPECTRVQIHCVCVELCNITHTHSL